MTLCDDCVTVDESGPCDSECNCCFYGKMHEQALQYARSMATAPRPLYKDGAFSHSFAGNFLLELHKFRWNDVRKHALADLLIRWAFLESEQLTCDKQRQASDLAFDFILTLMYDMSLEGFLLVRTCDYQGIKYEDVLRFVSRAFASSRELSSEQVLGLLKFLYFTYQLSEEDMMYKIEHVSCSIGDFGNAQHVPRLLEAVVAHPELKTAFAFYFTFNCTAVYESACVDLLYEIFSQAADADMQHLMIYLYIRYLNSRQCYWRIHMFVLRHNIQTFYKCLANVTREVDEFMCLFGPANTTRPLLPPAIDGKRFARELAASDTLLRARSIHSSSLHDAEFRNMLKLDHRRHMSNARLLFSGSLTFDISGGVNFDDRRKAMRECCRQSVASLDAFFGRVRSGNRMVCVALFQAGLPVPAVETVLEMILGWRALREQWDVLQTVYAAKRSYERVLAARFC